VAVTQSLTGLKRVAEQIKRQHKANIYKEQVSSLNLKLNKQREKTRAEEARAEYAERQVRQIAAERDIWKHRALEAEAELKSAGRSS
jgi:hypothetical protein